jgi:hypothetical protein
MKHHSLTRVDFISNGADEKKKAYVAASSAI